MNYLLKNNPKTDSDIYYLSRGPYFLGSHFKLFIKNSPKIDYDIDYLSRVPYFIGSHFKLFIKDSLKIDSDIDYLSRVLYYNDVRSLMYVMVCTRPNIAQGVSVEQLYVYPK